MKIIIPFIVFAHCCNSLFAQPAFQWQKSLGGSEYDNGVFITQSNDGGYVALGNTASNDGDVFGTHGGVDYWVLKLDHSGAIKWKKIWGGSLNDIPTMIIPTFDGGYLISGYTSSSDFDVSSNHGKTDGWLVKINESGIVQWKKTYGGSERDYFYSVIQSPEVGYVAVGSSDSNNGDVSGNHGISDWWIVKLDSLGTIIWSKLFGGSSFESANYVVNSSDNTFVIVGDTHSNDGDVVINNGSTDNWIVKLSSSGEILWQKSYGGVGAELPREIHQTADNGFIIVGTTGSHNSGQVFGHSQLGGYDVWVTKLGDSGELQWQKPMGGTGEDYGNSIVQLNDGGYIVECSTQSGDGDVSGPTYSQDIWLVKLSATGEIIWQKKYGGSDGEDGGNIIETSDYGLAFTGFSWSNDGDLAGQTNHGFTDLWVVKFSPETVKAVESERSDTISMTLYPNPATESVYLQIPDQKASVQVRVFDFSGRKVLDQELPNDSELKTGNLPGGIYSVITTSETGRSWSSNLVIRHDE